MGISPLASYRRKLLLFVALLTIQSAAFAVPGTVSPAVGPHVLFARSAARSRSPAARLIRSLKLFSGIDSGERLSSAEGAAMADEFGIAAGQAPSPPNGLAASIATTQVTLTWPGITNQYYNLYRSTNGNASYSMIACGITISARGIYSPTTYSQVDGSVTSGVQYYYALTQVVDGVESGFSNQVSVIAGSPVPLTFNSIGGTGLVALSWSPSLDPNTTGYSLARSTNAISGFTQIYSGGISQLYFTDYTAANGTNYYYALTAVGSSSSAYNQASATPSASAPTDYYAVSFSGGEASDGSSFSPAGPEWGGGVYSDTVSDIPNPGQTTYVRGNLTATFTWVGPDDFPTNVQLAEFADAESESTTEYYDLDNDQAQVDNGLGGGSIVGGGYLGYGEEGAISPISGAPPANDFLQIVAGSQVYTLTLAPLATTTAISSGETFAGADAYFVAGAGSADLQLKLSGAKPVPGSSTAFTVAPGQQLTATCYLPNFDPLAEGVYPPGGTFSWTVTGGSPFKNYVSNANMACQFGLTSSDLVQTGSTSSELPFYFGSASPPNTPTSLTCSYTYTDSGGTKHTVSVPSAKAISITVLDPTFDPNPSANNFGAIDGTMQLGAGNPIYSNFSFAPGNAGANMIALWGVTSVVDGTKAGILTNDQVSDPSGIVLPPGGVPGQWGHVQTIDGFGSKLTFSTNGPAPIASIRQHELDSQAAAPTDSIDPSGPGNYPGAYPADVDTSGNAIWMTTAGSGQSHENDDSPDLPWLQYTNVASAEFYTANFNTYIFYTPPTGLTLSNTNTVCVYVPIRSYSWTIPDSTATAPSIPSGAWTPGGGIATSGSGTKPTITTNVYPQFPWWLAPPASLSVGISPTSHKPVLNWEQPGWASVTFPAMYTVYRNGSSLANYSTNLGCTTGTTMTDSTAVAGTYYSYVVVASYTPPAAATGYGVSSVQPVTLASGNSMEAFLVPSAPSGLSATKTNGTVALTWSASAGASGYSIYRNGGRYDFSNVNSYTDLKPATGTNTYYVVATNSGGASPASNTVSVTLP
jgi:fibronectin type 3 domain-containing protein